MKQSKAKSAQRKRPPRESGSVQIKTDKLPIGLKLVQSISSSHAPRQGLAWSPNGELLVSSSVDVIEVWSAASAKPVRHLGTDSNRCTSVVFDPTGGTLAAGMQNGQVILWNAITGEIARILKGPVQKELYGIAWSPDGRFLAACYLKGSICVWNTSSWQTVRRISHYKDAALDINWDRNSQRIAIASYHAVVWKVSSKKLVRMLAEKNAGLYSVAWSPRDSDILAAGSSDRTIDIWNTASGRLERSLEGHTGHVRRVRFSGDGELLASSSEEGVRLWDCTHWREVAALSIAGQEFHDIEIAFHPLRPTIALKSKFEGGYRIEIYEIDVETLRKRSIGSAVTYVSAKVVLVGDSGVGKTGLGWRLAHGKFKEHASTHGQQFFLLNQLSHKRRDGAECEAVLWDLAGQDDYRLIHALFLDDTDLALVLFDPGRPEDPLGGVDFWLKQLKVGTQKDLNIPAILVAARSDRGSPRLTVEELKAYCDKCGLAKYVSVSALTGNGVDDLVQQLRSLIPWDRKPATVTTDTFKRIKDFVLELKQNPHRRKVVLTPRELHKRLSATDRQWRFADDQMLTAVGHLATHGYVTKLTTSNGETRILLVPELLNNLAASFVLEARGNRRGLGSLEEDRLLSGGYGFPELKKLTGSESSILVDSATALFLKHNVCLRETDPLTGRAYLVFPELINLKRPAENDMTAVVDGAAYTVCGATENVYASLVVLMGYTPTFSRTNQWKNHAQYEVGAGQVCGFRLEAERAGELDLVLYYGADTSTAARMLFQGLFESLLARRNLSVMRLDPIACKNGHHLNRAVARDQMSSGHDFAFCNVCGERITLPKAEQPIRLSAEQTLVVKANKRSADERSRFEQVLFRLKNYVIEQKIAIPQCFISYAWGDPVQERWVEKQLAADLQKSGISVVLDRWENARIGASVPRFVERIAQCQCVIVVGTPSYRAKYDNGEPMRGFVVAAEGDLIGKRMIGTEIQKESVLPVLLDGTEETSFPALLHGRVYGDFRKPYAYLSSALDLLLSIYRIRSTDRIAADLREYLADARGAS